MTRDDWAELVFVLIFIVCLVLTWGLTVALHESPKPTDSEPAGTSVSAAGFTVRAPSRLCQVPAQEVVHPSAPPGPSLCPGGVVTRIDSVHEPQALADSARGVGGLRPAESRAVYVRDGGRGGTPTPTPSRVWRCTAYCPCRKCCGPRSRGITASGTKADHPLVAAPRSIPFGTVLDIPGYGRVRVEDRGHLIQGYRLDVLTVPLPGEKPEQTHARARAWGVRWLAVEVVKGD